MDRLPAVSSVLTVGLGVSTDINMRHAHNRDGHNDGLLVQYPQPLGWRQGVHPPDGYEICTDMCVLSEHKIKQNEIK